MLRRWMGFAALAALACGDGSGVETADVTIIRGAAGSYHDLAVVGVGMSTYENRTVVVQIGMPDRPPERLGIGRATIDGGAFTLFFADVAESGLYKRKTLWIDVDDDGRCDDGEPVFTDYSPQLNDDLWRVDLSGTRQGCDVVVSDWPAL